MNIKQMTELDLNQKRVLIREDLNVPIKEGVVTSDARIRAALPTIKMAIDQGAEVILMSHLGRPTEGQFEAQYSLQPVANDLSSKLGVEVQLITDWSNGFDVPKGQIALLENVRFNKGEKANDDALSQAYAKLCDIYVMDAFGTAHRAQASTHGVAKFAPIACAGPLLANELNALETALATPAEPVGAIVGGSKVSTKLMVLETLADKVDQLGGRGLSCGQVTV
jgi:phosphoglycerate kinase